MAQNITFLGAAQTVTGSKHLLNLNGKKVLVDCGLFQGGRELRERNWEPFAVPPHEIDEVVLTHAHNDHIGYLPRLVRDGFRGPIWATPGTIGLCKVALPDSGRLQEEEARYHGKHGTSRHETPMPLYTEEDAKAVLKQLRPVRYFQWQPLPGGAQFRYIPAGHILGSAMAEVYFENGEKILMGGDLGRYDRPIIRDPEPVEYAEYLVLESTYGDRSHSLESAKEAIFEILDRAANDSGVVLFPSFAIGRTQELLWYMHELRLEGRLPNMPIYVDSPMANATTLLYTETTEDHDNDMKVDLSDGHSPLQGDWVRMVRDRNMSKALNTMSGPFVVISGSGMMNGGRILHHVRAHGANPTTQLVFTGYQAEGTIGRRLIDGDREISVLGGPMVVEASISTLGMLSAHADSDETMRWLSGFKAPPKSTFLVHGEYEAQTALKFRIETELGWNVVIPAHGESFDL